MKNRWMAGLAAIMLAGGCAARLDNVQPLDYGSRTHSSPMSFRIPVLNGVNNASKSPVIVCIDDREPVVIERGQCFMLPRGTHVIEVRSPTASAAPVRQAINIEHPVKVVVRDPAIAATRKKNAIETKDEWAGEIVLNVPNGSATWAPCLLDTSAFMGRGQFTIDDYPPIRVYYPFDRTVLIPAGRHRIHAKLTFSGNDTTKEYSGTYDIPPQGACLSLFEKECDKQTTPSGFYVTPARGARAASSAVASR